VNNGYAVEEESVFAAWSGLTHLLQFARVDVV
jgi:hypothetical protein